MPQDFAWVAGLFLAIFPGAIAYAASDTANLAASFKAVRGEKWLRNAQYRSLQREYLAWIDARLKTGGTADSMNRELRGAGFFPRQLDVADELDANHVGYLEPISPRRIRSGADVFVIAVAVYKGIGCNDDETAVLYQRRPLKRLAYLNADESQNAYYLSGVDVGGEDSTGERIVATGWVASNCTSTWNGKRIRIDLLRGSSVERLFARELDAQDRAEGEGESVAPRVARGVVTFRYQGGIGDAVLLSGASVARYQIIKGRAVLESPLALTRAGFIHEWLELAEADAARWGEPEAVAMRASAVSSIVGHGFEWERIARCGGSPPVWEIAIRPYDSKTVEVFRIGGTRATELRMLAVTDRVTRSCVPEDISKGLTGAAAELPW